MGGNTLNHIVSNDNVAPFGQWGIWLDLRFDLQDGLEYQLSIENDSAFNFENELARRSVFVCIVD